MSKKKGTKKALAKELGVSRSSLYYRRKKPLSDMEEKAMIEAIMHENPAYGGRRVSIALSWNRKKAMRLMQKYKLKPRLRRGFRLVKLDDLGRPETAVVNILKILCPTRPNIVWAGDFTYFWFRGRFWYLATVIDVHTREVLGWHLANHHTTSLIMEAWKDAVRKTGSAPMYFHSDQGSEYVSGAYESLLASWGTKISHARKSSPWQNGHQESFYANFKLELGSISHFQDVGELIEAIAKQIAYYNHRRIHLALRMAPVQFRIKQEQKQLAGASA